MQTHICLFEKGILDFMFNLEGGNIGSGKERRTDSLRKTKIVPWTNDWVNSYKKEEKILKDIFLNELLEIHHIGSTSIPTIGYAKPIIDILIVVKDIENVDLFNDEMRTWGYEPRGENGIAGRRYFPKSKEKRTHHVHIYQAGNEKIKIHLDFKEYLINFPDDAKSYGELKIKLARQFPNEHQKYQDGKQQFVNELADKAKEWAIQRRSN